MQGNKKIVRHRSVRVPTPLFTKFKNKVEEFPSQEVAGEFFKLHKNTIGRILAIRKCTSGTLAILEAALEPAA